MPETEPQNPIVAETTNIGSELTAELAVIQVL